MPAEAPRVVGGRRRARASPKRVAQQRGDAARVLLVGRDHEPAGVGLLAAHLGQPVVRRAQHAREPVALERQRGPQALARARRVEAVVERRRVDRAVRRRPLHLAVRAREVDRPHDAAVGERVAVAVLEVGHGLVAAVGDERDRARVGAERRARQRQAPTRRREGLLDRGAPRALVGGVVQLVEARRRRPCASRAQQRRARRDLLVGGDDPVHVGREAPVGRRPGRVEVQRERRGRTRPLHLQVRGRRDDDQPSRAVRRAAAAPPSARRSSCRRRASPPPGSRACQPSTNWSRAAFCHGRKRMILVILERQTNARCCGRCAWATLYDHSGAVRRCPAGRPLLAKSVGDELVERRRASWS